MAYKPEVIGKGRHRGLYAGALARARKTAKKAVSRLMRRAAKQDPENAPVTRIRGGYLD